MKATVLKEDGNLYFIPELPDNPDPNSTVFEKYVHYSEAVDKYYDAIASSLPQAEKLRRQVFYNGQWNDETAEMYWKLINNNHHGRILNSQGVIVESTEGAPTDSQDREKKPA